MNTEKMRAEFETWAIQQAKEHKYEYMPNLLARTSESGGYNTTWVDSAWMGWQASRESLVIELPDRLKAEQAGAFQSQESVNAYVSGFNRAMASAQKAIEDTGLKVAK